jgi:hypothetical protein
VGARAENGKYSGTVRATTQHPTPTTDIFTMMRSKQLRSLVRPGKRASCLARSALLACIAIAAAGGFAADAGT